MKRRRQLIHRCQALRVTTSIKISRDVYGEFKQLAKRKGLTVCDLLEDLMKRWLLEQRAGKEKGGLPIITIHRVDRLRRGRIVPGYTVGFGACPYCGMGFITIYSQIPSERARYYLER